MADSRIIAAHFPVRCTFTGSVEDSHRPGDERPFMTPLERIALQGRRHSIAIRAARLIDALIDGAHRGWPDVCFVMRLPSGEQIFVPAHRSAGPSCALGHAGYFHDRIRPFCEVDSTLHGGICCMIPLALDQIPPSAPAYQLDLRSGTLTSTRHPQAAVSHRVAGPVGDR